MVKHRNSRYSVMSVEGTGYSSLRLNGNLLHLDGRAINHRFRGRPEIYCGTEDSRYAWLIGRRYPHRQPLSEGIQPNEAGYVISRGRWSVLGKGFDVDNDLDPETKLEFEILSKATDARDLVARNRLIDEVECWLCEDVDLYPKTRLQALTKLSSLINTQTNGKTHLYRVGIDSHSIDVPTGKKGIHIVGWTYPRDTGGMATPIEEMYNITTSETIRKPDLKRRWTAGRITRWAVGLGIAASIILSIIGYSSGCPPLHRFIIPSQRARIGAYIEEKCTVGSGEERRNLYVNRRSPFGGHRPNSIYDEELDRRLYYDPYEPFSYVEATLCAEKYFRKNVQ